MWKAGVPSTEAELASGGRQHSWMAVMNHLREGNCEC